jgi:death-on-curing protein
MGMPPLPNEIYFLDLDQVVDIHDSLVKPGEDSSIRDRALLEQAVASPRAGHAGGFFNTSIFEMAAALIIGLANNHPFANGNKRTASISGIIFLAMNDYKFIVENKQLVQCILDVVQKKMNKRQLMKFLHRRSSWCRFDEHSTRIQRRSSTPTVH